MDRTFMSLGGSEEDEPTLEAEQAPGIRPAPKPARVQEPTPVDDQRVTDIRTSLLLTQAQAPDRAAKVRELAARLNLPTTVVDRDFDGLSQRYASNMVPAYRIARDAPALAGLLAHPETSPIVKDDVEPMEFLEWLMKRPVAAFMSKIATLEAAKIGAKRLTGHVLTSEEQAKYDTWTMVAEQGDASQDNTMVRKVLAGLPDFMANQGEVAYSGAPIIAASTMVGTALGAMAGSFSANPAGIAAGAAGGFRLGSKAGFFLGGAKFAYDTEGSMALDEYLGMHDEQGRKMSPETARRAAIAVGALNAGWEVLGLEILLKSIPGVKDWTKLGGRAAVKEVLKQPTLRKALFDAVGSYLKVLGGEVGTEIGQEATTMLGGEAAKDVERDAGRANIPEMTTKEAGIRLFDTAVSSTYAFALGVGFGPAMQFRVDTARAQRAQEGKDFIKTLGEGVAQSKTIQRDESLGMRFLREAAKDSPIKTVYATWSTWSEYWRQRGVDPDEVTLEVTGDAKAVQAAQDTGFVEIPIERYAVKLAATEHNAFWMDEIRLRDPNEQNAREAAEWMKTEAPLVFDRLLAAQQTSETVPPTVTGQAGVAVSTSAATPAASLEQQGLPPTVVVTPLLPSWVDTDFLATLSDAGYVHEIARLEKRIATGSDDLGYKRTERDEEYLGVLKKAQAIRFGQETPATASDAVVHRILRSWDVSDVPGEQYYAPYSTQDLWTALEAFEHTYPKMPGEHLVSVGRELYQEIERRTPNQDQQLNDEAARLTKAAAKAPTILHQDVHPAAVLYQSTQGEQRWYYSPLTVAITNWKQGRGTKEQVLAYLRTVKGAALEAEEMGLSEFLDEHPTVTKQQVRDFIAAHAVTIEETVKGEPSAVLTPEQRSNFIAELRSLGYDLETNDEETGVDLVTLEGRKHVYDVLGTEEDGVGAPERALELFELLSANEETSETEYNRPSLTLPGGKNYREILIRVPPKRETRSRTMEPPYRNPVEVRQNVHGDGLWYLVDRHGNWLENGYESREFAEEVLKPWLPLNDPQTAWYTESVGDVYVSPHWSEENVIFHLRVKDVTLADGRRALFVEEIQSDLHHQGRTEGYRSELQAKLADLRAKANARMESLGKPGGKRVRAMMGDDEYLRLSNEANDLEQKLKNQYGAPDLPFRGDAWKRLAMRRLLALAAEGGYDALAWTTGQQQADRYSLDKWVDSVSYNPTTQTLYATEKGGGSVIEETVAPEKIGKYIGEEYATLLLEKVAAQAEVTQTRGVWSTKKTRFGWELIAPNGKTVTMHPSIPGANHFRTEEAAYAYADDMMASGRIETLPSLSGDETKGLKVGGEKKRALYDGIFVNVANQLGKPFGVRTEMGATASEYVVDHGPAGGWRLWADGELIKIYDTEAEANDAKTKFETMGEPAGWYVDRRPDAGQGVTWAVYNQTTNLVAGPFSAKDRATEELLTLQYQGAGNRQPAHVLSTPPAMRDELLAKGQPLYQVKEGEAQPAAAVPAATETLDFTVEDLMRSLGLTRTQAQYTFAVADAMGLDLSHIALARGGRPDPAALYSLKEWKATNKKGEKIWAKQFIAKATEFGWDEEAAEGAVDLIDGVITIFEKYKEIFPQQADPKAGSAIYPNADFKYTFDVNRTCMRVVKYWSTVKEVEAAIGHPLNEFEMLRLGQMMRQDGDLPGCIYCYVEAGRRANQRNAVKFMQAKASDPTLTDAVKKRFTRRDALLTELKWSVKRFAKYVTREDFDIDAEIERHKDQPLGELLGLYGIYVGAGKGAKRTGHSVYGHTILRMKPGVVDETNARAGLRWQSSTDLDPTQLAERLKGYADSSVVGLRGHEYAKEPFAVLIFGDTGIKQNLSVALNWNGTEFVSDDVNGMPLSRALELRELYSNAGTMLTAKNLEQIRWALDSPLIDMIIPHHAGGWSEHGFTVFDLDDFATQAGSRVHEEWIDESIAPKWQAGETLPQGKKVGAVKTPSEFYTGGELWITSYLNTYNGNEKDAVTAYLAFCAAQNMHPKWSGGKYYDRHTESTQAFPDFTGHANYIKLLRDYARTDSPQVALDISRVNQAAMRQFMDMFIAQEGFADRQVANPKTTERFVALLKSGQPLDISEAEKKLLKSRRRVGEESVVKKVLTRAQFEKSLGSRPLPVTVLDQLGLGVPQASVEFLKNARALIRGFAAADASSGVHELAHIARRWLFTKEMPSDQRQGITDEDIEIAEAECGVINGEWTVEAEEKFARMFERYLRDGQSPSEKLAELFAKMAKFLTEVYATVTGTAIDIPVSPAMRQVFDNLMTRSERLTELTQQADQAAAQAQATANLGPMLTPEAAGMTPEAFELYRQQIEDASKQQREALRQRALEQVSREARAEWRARKAEMNGQVTEELANLPVYRAIFAIRQGTTALGESLLDGKPPQPMFLDRAAIVAEFGKERLARIPRGLATTENGLNPADVAGQFGFPSVDAMLTALEQTTPFSKAVRDEVNRRMVAENGSLMEPAALADRAQEALANDSHESVLRAELRALKKAQRAAQPFLQVGEDRLTQEQREREYERQWLEAEARLRIAIAEGRKQAEIDALRDKLAGYRGLVGQYEKSLPRAADLRAMARARLAATRISAINPRTFWSASRAAAADAAKAFLKNDLLAAEQAKARELAAIALYREALKARDETEAGLRTADTLASPAGQARLGLAGQTYQDAVNTVLDQFDLAFISHKALARRINLRDWMDTQEVNDLPADLPDILVTQALRISYKELTLGQFRDVIDGLKNISHLAKLKNKLLKLKHARDMDSLVDKLRLSAFAAKGQHQMPVEFRRAEKRKRSIAGIFAEHSRIATLAYELDEHQEGGVWWQTFIKPLNDASVWERQRKKTEGTRLWDIVTAHYTAREISQLTKTRFIPALGRELSNEARLSIALNWGRAENRDRLLSDTEGRKWTADQVQAVLDTLEERDWTFVQAVWNFNGSFREEMAAKQRRVTGIEPAWSEPAPVETRYGTFPGGYYHIAYDSNISAKAGQQEEQTSAHLSTAAAYISSTTKRGHLKEVAKHVERPLALTLDVEFRHLDDVIHDLAYHETLIDLNRVFRRVGQTLYEAAGNDTLYTEFKSALQDVASGLERPKSGTGRFFARARTGTQLALLGMNFWTAAQQVTGIFNGAADIGGVWVMRGTLKWLSSPRSIVEVPRWIAEVSPFMRDRTKNATMEISEVRDKLAEPGGWFDLGVRQMTGGRVTALTMADAMMWHIAQMQKCADIPVWLGSYEKAMATAPVELTQEKKEARAVALADQSVRDTQGTADIHDLARVERGNVFQRLFTVFYHYGNTVFNTSRKIAGRTDFRSPKELALMMGDFFLLYAMPAAATVTLAQVLGKRPESEDWWDFFCEVGLESLATAFNTMVGLREIGSAAVMALDPSRTGGVRGYEGPAGIRFMAAAYKLTYKAGEGDFDADFWRTANQLAGIYLHYPALQVERTVRGALAIMDGQTQNPAALLVGPPPKQR